MQKLREYRLKAELTQEALAELAGVSRRSIVGNENGTALWPPSVRLLMRLAAVLAERLGGDPVEIVGELAKDAAREWWQKEGGRP